MYGGVFCRSELWQMRSLAAGTPCSEFADGTGKYCGRTLYPTDVAWALVNCTAVAVGAGRTVNKAGGAVSNAIGNALSPSNTYAGGNGACGQK
jgi:hypothetical protein